MLASQSGLKKVAKSFRSALGALSKTLLSSVNHALTSTIINWKLRGAVSPCCHIQSYSLKTRWTEDMKTYENMFNSFPLASVKVLEVWFVGAVRYNSYTLTPTASSITIYYITMFRTTAVSHLQKIKSKRRIQGYQ